MSKHTELDCRPLHLLFHNELKYTQKNPFWQKINVFEIIFESKLKTQSLSAIITETKFKILSNSALSCLGKWTFSPYLSSQCIYLLIMFSDSWEMQVCSIPTFSFFGVVGIFFYQQILLFLSKNNTLLIRLVVVVESKCSLGIYSFLTHRK